MPNFSPQGLRIALLLTLILTVAAPHLAQGVGDMLTLTPENISDGFNLDKNRWLYHAGDDRRWASPEYDDAEWERVLHPMLNFNSMPRDGWHGAAWYRLRLRVDERLVNQPLAFRFFHWGASEIYLDGKLIKSFGVIGADRDTELNPHEIPVPLVFTDDGTHTLAVRYSFKRARDVSGGVGWWLMRGRFLPGFDSYMETADNAIAEYGRRIRGAQGYRSFTGILYAFALLHLLLFVFYRRERGNLYYSLFAFTLAIATTLGNIANNTSQIALTTAIIFILFVAMHAVAFLFLLAFLYVAFAPRFSLFFWMLLALLTGLVVMLMVFLKAQITLYATCLLFILILADAIRIMIQALIRRRDGAWIIMTGVLFFGCAILILLVGELDIVDFDQWIIDLNEISILLAVPFAVSIYLARNFARTNFNLEAQLVNVKELSARQMEQERTAAELRLQHEQTRAENERRAKELEEARRLQLSMLPAQVPQLPDFEIAAYMKPATEVGGDYYDFHISEDGTLTVVIGDATGHGLKAGTVVTATKSLFNAFASEPDIITFFRASSRALKAMNLRGLFMAMTMIKIKDRTLIVSAAGMPAMLIYRAATQTIEEVALTGMPLGSVLTFPYKQRTLELSTGDLIMLMSDGFPERFNVNDEMIDYTKAKAVLAEVARASPQAIINHFVEVGDEWAGSRAQDDDVTFVVLKVKN